MGAQSIAVCLLHAYANPAHERRIAQVIAARHPDIRVSLSSEVSPEHREYERTSTTVIDAYIGPAVDRCLTKFGERAADLGYSGTPLIMQSNGGAARDDLRCDRISQQAAMDIYGLVPTIVNR